jgi:hypothetical protein
VCQHAVMGDVRGGGRRGHHIAAAVTVLAILAASLFLTGPMTTAVRSVTGGNWAVDVAVGVLLVIAPMAAVVAYAFLAPRRRWPQSGGWWLLVLYLPAFDLEPFSRYGTNTRLQHRINTQLPGLLGGMLAGVLLLVACFAVPVLMARHKRRGQARQ